jgi:hypothetical protein
MSDQAAGNTAPASASSNPQPEMDAVAAAAAAAEMEDGKPRKRRREKREKEEEEEEEAKEEEKQQENEHEKKRKKKKTVASSSADIETAPASASSSTPFLDPSEVRLRPWVPLLYPDVRVRMQRALQQRLFLISWKETAALTRVYQVLGATGNVYTVTITQEPKCTCPDAAKGYRCKHLLFILFRVLKVGKSNKDATGAATRGAYDPLLYQNAYTSAELWEMFHPSDSSSRTDAATLRAEGIEADEKVAAAYRKLMGETETEGKENESEAANVETSLTGQPRKPITSASEESVDCGICFDILADGTALVWCKAQCGNNLHAACFEKWKSAKMRAGDTVDCPYCRAHWVEESSGAAGSWSGSAAQPAHVGGYVNLSAFSAAHQDASNPYEGPTYSGYGYGWRGYGRSYGSGWKKKGNRYQ